MQCALLVTNVANRHLLKQNHVAAMIVIAIAGNMGERWKTFRSGTLRTMLAGFLYILTLPAVRNWLMSLFLGKRKQNQKIIDVEVKKG